MSFAEVKKNLALAVCGCPCRARRWTWHSLARWWTNTWRRDSIALIPRGCTWAAKVSLPSGSALPSATAGELPAGG